MNKRLSAITGLISNGIGVVDVGTDHGYIPVFLASNGYLGNIFASDINSAPLSAAEHTAVSAGVSDRINFLLCDGLEKCPPDKVDTIIAAGMGGDLICRILDYAEWCMDSRYKLILQPMTKIEVVRYWLSMNGFKTEKEVLVEDNGIIYQIITASFDGYTAYTDAELFAGKYELTDDKGLYVKNINDLCYRFDKAVKGAESGSVALYKINFYKTILKELEELGKKYGDCC